MEVHQRKLVCWNRMGGIPPPGITEPASPSIPVWRGDAVAAAKRVVVVGSPIGCDEFVAQHGARRLQEEEPLLAELRDMPSTQVACLLFYLCAVPRANHSLRTVPPFVPRANHLRDSGYAGSPFMASAVQRRPAAKCRCPAQGSRRIAARLAAFGKQRV